jgi:hypothetical protein
MRLLLLIGALLLAACTAPAADIPTFPGASIQPRGQNTMADALAGSFAMHIGRQPDDSAVQLFTVPAETTWAQTKGFYDERLSAAGWQPDAALLVEGDTFSYAGWSRGGQTFAIGLVENTIGDGAYLTTAIF